MATEVATGIHRCGTPLVNWYLVSALDGVTVVDAGLPIGRRFTVRLRHLEEEAVQVERMVERGRIDR